MILALATENLGYMHLDGVLGMNIAGHSKYCDKSIPLNK